MKKKATAKVKEQADKENTLKNKTAEVELADKKKSLKVTAAMKEKAAEKEKFQVDKEKEKASGWLGWGWRS